MLTGWHNFKTGETDYLSQGASLNFDDEQAKRYIDQSVAAQGYYECSRELGLSVFEAMLNTLSVSAGEPIKYELPENATAPPASEVDAADTEEE